jgi:hypothetical protein
MGAAVRQRSFVDAESYQFVPALLTPNYDNGAHLVQASMSIACHISVCIASGKYLFASGMYRLSVYS